MCEKNDEHKPDSEDDPYFVAAGQPTVNYFMIADALAHGCIPNAAKSHHTLLTTTAAFHLASKPSLRLSMDDAVTIFKNLDLCVAIAEYLCYLQN